MLTIYTKDNCEFCIQAKTVMKNRNIPFNESRLGIDFTREEITTQFPSMKSFPIIVENSTGRIIGGFSEFITELHKNGANFGKTLLNE